MMKHYRSVIELKCEQEPAQAILEISSYERLRDVSLSKCKIIIRILQQIAVNWIEI